MGSLETVRSKYWNLKRNTVKGLNIPEYDFKGVKGKIHTIREVIILPFVTTVVGHYELDDTFKMHECSCGASYGIFGSHCQGQILWGIKTRQRQIDVCLRNHSAKLITLPKQTDVGETEAANSILVLLVQKLTRHEAGRGEATAGKRKY